MMSAKNMAQVVLEIKWMTPVDMAEISNFLPHTFEIKLYLDKHLFAIFGYLHELSLSKHRIYVEKMWHPKPPIQQIFERANKSLKN